MNFRCCVIPHPTRIDNFMHRQCFEHSPELDCCTEMLGGGPRVVVSTTAFHARVRGSVPGLGGLKETKIVSSPSTCES